MEVINIKSGLSRFHDKFNKLNSVNDHNDSLKVGFLGGSITEQKVWRNWPEPVLSELQDLYPNVRIEVENGAIGATGIQMGVLRAQRDILQWECDILFIEYAVNDYFTDSTRRKRAMEGLIRKCIGKMEIVMVYTFNQPMMKTMLEGNVPESIKDYEEIANYYGLDSVWVGKHALNEVLRGKIRWEEWLPDGLHPHNRGSLVYGEAIIKYLHVAIKVENLSNLDRTSLLPIDKDNWEFVELMDLRKARTKGPWKLRRHTESAFVDQFLETSAIGASLSCEFQGKGISLGFQFGKEASEYRYRIDGGEWKVSQRERPDWAGPLNWYRTETLFDDLADEVHNFELEVIHGDKEDCDGSRCHLIFIGIRK